MNTLRTAQKFPDGRAVKAIHATPSGPLVELARPGELPMLVTAGEVKGIKSQKDWPLTLTTEQYVERRIGNLLKQLNNPNIEGEIRKTARLIYGATRRKLEQAATQARHSDDKVALANMIEAALSIFKQEIGSGKARVTQKAHRAAKAYATKSQLVNASFQVSQILMPLAEGWQDATPRAKRQLGSALGLLRTELTRSDRNNPLVSGVSKVAVLIGNNQYREAWAAFEPLHTKIRQSGKTLNTSDSGSVGAGVQPDFIPALNKNKPYRPRALVHVRSLNLVGRVENVWRTKSGEFVYKLELVGPGGEQKGSAVASHGDLTPRRSKALKGDFSHDLRYVINATPQLSFNAQYAKYTWRVMGREKAISEGQKAVVFAKQRGYEKARVSLKKQAGSDWWFVTLLVAQSGKSAKGAPSAELRHARMMILDFTSTHRGSSMGGWETVRPSVLTKIREVASQLESGDPYRQAVLRLAKQIKDADSVRALQMAAAYIGQLTQGMWHGEKFQKAWNANEIKQMLRTRNFDVRTVTGSDQRWKVTLNAQNPADANRLVGQAWAMLGRLVPGARWLGVNVGKFREGGYGGVLEFGVASAGRSAKEIHHPQEAAAAQSSLRKFLPMVERWSGGVDPRTIQDEAYAIDAKLTFYRGFGSPLQGRAQQMAGRAGDLAEAIKKMILIEPDRARRLFKPLLVALTAAAEPKNLRSAKVPPKYDYHRLLSVQRGLSEIARQFSGNPLMPPMTPERAQQLIAQARRIALPQSPMAKYVEQAALLVKAGKMEAAGRFLRKAAGWNPASEPPSALPAPNHYTGQRSTEKPLYQKAQRIGKALADDSNPAKAVYALNAAMGLAQQEGRLTVRELDALPLAQHALKSILPLLKAGDKTGAQAHAVVAIKALDNSGLPATQSGLLKIAGQIKELHADITEGKACETARFDELAKACEDTDMKAAPTAGQRAVQQAVRLIQSAKELCGGKTVTRGTDSHEKACNALAQAAFMCALAHGRMSVRSSAKYAGIELQEAMNLL